MCYGPGMTSALLAAALLTAAPAQPPALSAERSVRPSNPAPPPAPADLTAGALAAFEAALTDHYGGTRNVPLEAKAAYYEWAILRHHFERFPDTPAGDPVGIVHHAAWLPEKPGDVGRFQTGSDTLTWNGALLAGMSYRWAVTRDPAALAWVRTLLGGLELGFAVTGQPGLPARCYTQTDAPVNGLNRRFARPGAPTIFVKSDAAKGTVNQIAGGLIACQLLCGEALGERDRGRAAALSLALADHLVRHDYHLTEADGKRTEFGDLTPRFGPQSLPFNAQVSYLIVAGGAGLGATAPNADAAAVARVNAAFRELRGEHHVYYESPTKLIRPQRVGNSPIVKGMNDRHHVFTAGYYGLWLEWELARRAGAGADGRFLYELGRTPLWAMRGVRGDRNALLAFLWAGLLSDGRRAAAILPDERERAAEFGLARAEVAAGVEHLRRFPLSRREFLFEEGSKRDDLWTAEQRPWDCYVWKADPDTVVLKTGPFVAKWAAGIDYTHAYWAARYWNLPLDDAP